MLALSRKPGEQVVIGNGITLTVVEVRGNRVRLAFDAPDQVRILRAELLGCPDEQAGRSAWGGSNPRQVTPGNHPHVACWPARWQVKGTGKLSRVGGGQSAVELGVPSSGLQSYSGLRKIVSR